jgi:hypothetical protein
VSSEDWKDKKYAEVLESEYKGLERRRELERGLEKASIERQLKDLYVQEGNDWLGRGELGDIVLTATIAAYERFVHDWKD